MVLFPFSSLRKEEKGNKKKNRRLSLRSFPQRDCSWQGMEFQPRDADFFIVTFKYLSVFRILCSSVSMWKCAVFVLSEARWGGKSGCTSLKTVVPFRERYFLWSDFLLFVLSRLHFPDFLFFVPIFILRVALGELPVALCNLLHGGRTFAARRRRICCTAEIDLMPNKKLFSNGFFLFSRGKDPFWGANRLVFCSDFPF